MEEGESHRTLDGKPYRRFLCRCDCGVRKLIRIDGLRRGDSRSCGCLQKESRTRGGWGSDVTGQRFGRLVVLQESNPYRSPSGIKKRRFLCRCDCGTEKTIRLSHLRSGDASSCGCLQKETGAAGFYGNPHLDRARAWQMQNIIDGFLGWTTDYLYFLPVDDTYALVDEEDFFNLSQRKWYLIITPSGSYYAYTIFSKGRKKLTARMHQIILPLPKGFEVDHKNCNGLDNRRHNLRAATHSQNCANRTVGGKNKRLSKYKGVSKKNRKWSAAVQKDGTIYRLGSFTTEQEAARAYNEAAKRLFGEFARVNRI